MRKFEFNEQGKYYRKLSLNRKLYNVLDTFSIRLQN